VGSVWDYAELAQITTSSCGSKGAGVSPQAQVANGPGRPTADRGIVGHLAPCPRSAMECRKFSAFTDSSLTVIWNAISRA
jgi:hypothetical protein